MMVMVRMILVVMTGDGGYVMMMGVRGEDDIGCDGDDDFDGYVM